MTNKTKKTVLARKKRLLTRILQHAFGLMGRKKLDDEGWIFIMKYTSNWHITNLFVFQTIDVLWLDANKTVLQTATIPAWKAHQKGIAETAYVIELPQETLTRSNTEVDDVIDWA